VRKNAAGSGCGLIPGNKNFTCVYPCIMHECNCKWWPTRSNYFCLFLYSQSALHVSGDVFAHHQEHVPVFTASDNVHQYCCRLVSWMRWNCISECVFVALDVQHAKRMHRIVICGLSGCTIFYTLSHERKKGDWL